MVDIGPLGPHPVCPICGALLNIDFVEVRSLGAKTRHLPGEMTCSAHPTHDVSTARAETSWPAELTHEDREWLRRQIRLADGEDW